MVNSCLSMLRIRKIICYLLGDALHHETFLTSCDKCHIKLFKFGKLNANKGSSWQESDSFAMKVIFDEGVFLMSIF